MTAELEFRAMGSDAHVIVVGSDGLAADLAPCAARRRIDDLEQRWSRFVESSEVNELTRRAGTTVSVSPETVLLVERAVEAWRLTGGSFDPTVLGDVIRAGYDRSFDELPEHTGGRRERPDDGLLRHPDHRRRRPAPGRHGIRPRRHRQGPRRRPRRRRGHGCRCGRCVHQPRGRPARPRRVADRPARAGGSWTVAVEHQWSSEPIVNLGLSDGAVATSTTLRRRWDVDGEARHHLIDPGTGRPAATDLTLATVVAGEAWVAEVLAKAVLLRGLPHPFDLIGGTGAEALVVDDTGRVLVSDGFTAFTGGVLPGPIPVPG